MMTMERALGAELRKVSNLTHRYFEQNSNKARVDAITGTNSWIIGFVAHQEEMGREVYQRDLETRFGITRSTASKVVNLMVQKGLLEQQSVPEDRRLKKLKLTERALEVKQLMDEDHVRFEATLRKGLSPEEVNTLFALLDRIKQNLTEEEMTEECEKK